jgi:hypothetical protein
MKHEGPVYTAQFSPDGQRVVTASMDWTARVWDAASGKEIGESMKHGGPIISARFSPDSQRVVTASEDKTAQLWDTVVVTDKDTRDDILLLAELADATGGVTFETVAQAENLTLLTPEQSEETREKIAAKYARMSSGLTPLQRWLKWSVSDRRSRAISPFSQETVPEWLENRIKEKTVEGLRSAMQVDPANARVTAHLGRRLADQALKLGTDPDEARRARGEADFLTSRARRLAPDSVEVKSLRDEVNDIPITTLGPTAAAITSVPLLKGHAVIRYNPTAWRPDRTVKTLPGEFQVVHETGEVWLKVVAESLEHIGTERVAEISLTQIKNLDPMAKVTRQGSRRVNGLNMTFREIEAAFEGEPFTFYNHYYCDTSGCIQFLGWAKRSLLEEHRGTIEEFLEGFEVTALTPGTPSPETTASPPPMTPAPKPSSTVTGEEKLP